MVLTNAQINRSFLKNFIFFLSFAWTWKGLHGQKPVDSAQRQALQSNFPEDWSRPFPPFRIVGNLYYVGTYDLAVYLITTPGGHLLINTGLAGSDTLIRSNIKKLGFRFSDIKVLLATHVHFDHVGAMASIKRLTGAALMIEAEDAPVLADGGKSDYIFGSAGPGFAAVKADRLLHDRDTVRLGGMKVLVLHHPGHTKGACSFLFDVKDEHRSYRVLIANMPTDLDQADLAGMPAYPGIAKDYAYTLAAMKSLSFDIWLSSHASQFALHEKHSPSDGYRPEAFIDRLGYDSEIDRLKAAYLKKLASDKTGRGLSHFLKPGQFIIEDPGKGRLIISGRLLYQ